MALKSPRIYLSAVIRYPSIGRGFTLKAFNVGTANALGLIIIYCTFHRNPNYNINYKSDPEKDEIEVT